VAPQTEIRTTRFKSYQNMPMRLYFRHVKLLKHCYIISYY